MSREETVVLEPDDFAIRTGVERVKLVSSANKPEDCYFVIAFGDLKDEGDDQSESDVPTLAVQDREITNEESQISLNKIIRWGLRYRYGGQQTVYGPGLRDLPPTQRGWGYIWKKVTERDMSTEFTYMKVRIRRGSKYKVTFYYP